MLWNDHFAPGGETPLTGDFTGDGKDDAVSFTHGTGADVYVGASDGGSFAADRKWSDHFSPGREVPAVGDLNGDGKDDIITFTREDTADVYVALSDGTSFGTGQKWHDDFAPWAQFPAVGDVNGDGRDDIIAFTQDASNDVYVALNEGDRFGTPRKVHDHFAPEGERPRVGDVNGDGKDDIVTFTGGEAKAVYVALSDGAVFGEGRKWADFLALDGEFPYMGDYNGDGKDDIVTFTHSDLADVYVNVSNGTDGFVNGAKWHDFFGLAGETSL
ncbi:FG-GAP repeat domain-containing protein [Streptomyces sp. NPDC015127]|uniref:FG-GAP repeat domain-containing protein n=1 Tax=Streptomyces sp. NPDC015127 TaxID=3364939 RepID=UPI0036FF0097